MDELLAMLQKEQGPVAAAEPPPATVNNVIVNPVAVNPVTVNPAPVAAHAGPRPATAASFDGPSNEEIGRVVRFLFGR